MENHYDYTIQIEEADEGGYLVRIPALNGAVTQGETLQHAIKMGEDLIRCYVGSRIMRGLPIPVIKALRKAAFAPLKL